MKIVKPSYEILIPANEAEWNRERKLIERIARVCYKSEDKITDTSWQSMLKMLNDKNHGAMLEHSRMSVLFVCDRGVSHELVRHRLCSFAQESTRYCNYSKDKFGNEITVLEPFVNHCDNEVYKSWSDACHSSEKEYFNFLEKGYSPQIARSVLPNSLKTEIVVTTNFREWQHIFRLRAISKAAHPQMRELLVPLYEYCRSILPEVFDLGNAD